MRTGVLVIAAALMAPVLVAASEPVWVFIEPPSAEAERDFMNAKEDVKADIAAGVLKMRVGGFPGPDEHTNSLLVKLGIEPVEQGCVVIESVYSRVYFEAMEKEIERRHGADFGTRFDKEVVASRERARASLPKRDLAADRKYWRAVADHIGSYWNVPPNVPGGRQCSSVVLFDERATAAETQFFGCPDTRLQSSVLQAVQASLPLPAEIASLRTPNQLFITFEVPQDQIGEDEVGGWDQEWQEIQDFIQNAPDTKQ